MKIIHVKDAVGLVLCHDITKITDEFKGAILKRGHIVTQEDIPLLLSIGKEHLYIWEDKEGLVHEDEAARRLKELTGGDGLYYSEASEGKITFFAAMDGLIKIDVENLLALNCLGEMILSTVYNNTVVKKGDKVAATRVIPLVIEEEKIKKAEEMIKNKIVSVIPIHKKKVAIVTTGNEVYTGKIKDASYPILKEKLAVYQCEVIGQSILPDNLEAITTSIHTWIGSGAEMVICTGGMSVDPDDVTPNAIKSSGATIITYGSPVLPGAMLVVAYKETIPILGLPAGVIFSKRSVLDVILPRILAGERLTHHEIAAYGHGGLL